MQYVQTNLLVQFLLQFNDFILKTTGNSLHVFYRSGLNLITDNINEKLCFKNFNRGYRNELSRHTLHQWPMFNTCNLELLFTTKIISEESVLHIIYVIILHTLSEKQQKQVT